MMRHHRKSLFLMLVIAVILLASVLPGCGDSDQEPAPTPVPTETPAEAPTTTPAPPPAETPKDTPAPVPEESTTMPEEPVPQDEPPAEEDTTPAPAQEELKQINIIYVEGNNPVSDKEIWLSYFDEKTETWITENELTDNEGMTTFSVPEGGSGESYRFIFGFSEAEVKKYTLEINDLKRPALRIPPDSSCKVLTLELDNNYALSIIEGTAETVLLWSP